MMVTELPYGMLAPLSGAISSAPSARASWYAAAAASELTATMATARSLRTRNARRLEEKTLATRISNPYAML